VGINKKRHT